MIIQCLITKVFLLMVDLFDPDEVCTILRSSIHDDLFDWLLDLLFDLLEDDFLLDEEGLTV